MTSMDHDDERRTSTEDILAGTRADEQPETPETRETPEARETRERPVYPGEATTTGEEPREGDTAGGAETAGTGEAGGRTGRTVEGEVPADGGGKREERESLLPPAEAEELRSRWQEVQTRFVDAPREAVRDADELVADLMRRLAEYFAGRKHGLESQWNRDGEADTEELRVALKQYRVFFDRLLSS
ncbi:hypothetical protein [Kitasatospora sp. NPDC096204]|uniref:hypothetical protein n=1 Tax=Kitasatospora sp. NPDC096204 TaxID=3364094 RepID=UPI0037FA2D97